MTTMQRNVLLTVLTGVSVACGGPATPSGPTSVPASAALVAGVALNDSAAALPDWVVNPAELPEGLVGTNNCTFEFAQAVDWDFHPDAGCWEHDGPDGWTRQQGQRLHVAKFAACNDGPGDLTFIRVCRPGGAGQPTPCHDANGNVIMTGGKGCAACVANPVCH